MRQSTPANRIGSGRISEPQMTTARCSNRIKNAIELTSGTKGSAPRNHRQVKRSTISDIAPIVSDTVSLFGAERCMWGSNFPIEKLWTDYATLVSNIRQAVSHLTPGEQRQILSETARRLYGIV